ncbi:NAD(P)-dependent oxidoreductase [Aspergillus tanneri]|uniref:Uncharacterized protein n=1 Tax=Aspergillus tanneri TaxID=1220188 RepID=A0A5M9MYC0_9EURO|nr:uncharacterized protein ATNIH1004_000746 [Aspergillus tanneri]KAA8651848.1 hypothetical protein ATNIH1004_000746 [Aspergillus tanneri]
MAKSISLIGLGAMGAALASQYITHNYQTTVWNRTVTKATPLVQKGARLASSVSEAILATNLIAICLLDKSAVQETLSPVLSSSPSSLAGKTIIDVTSCTPNEARELSALIIPSGARYIHGGIMAVPDMIGSAYSTLLCSGGESEDTFTAIRGDLSLIGTPRYLGTDAGRASLYDLALLSGLYGLCCLKGGTSITGFLELLKPWLTVMMGYLDVMAKQIDEGEYATQGANLGMQMALTQSILKVGEEQGVSSDLVLPLRRLVERAVADGRGGEDLAAINEYLKR